MAVHEYKVIPAPNRPEKVSGVKSTAEKFARSLTGLMNEMGREGWEYVRAETLPCEEKKGWAGRRETTFQTVLVFRRDLAAGGAPVSVATPALPAPAGPPAMAAPQPAGGRVPAQAGRAEKVVRRLWSRDEAAPPSVPPAAGAAPAPVPPADAGREGPGAALGAAQRTDPAPGAAPRVVSVLPERPASRGE